MDRVISIYKAQSYTKELPVESVKINIEETIPDFKTLEELDKICETKAKYLEAALHNSLPGAIYDRLLAAMLQRTASHFVVPHGRQ